MRVIIDNDFSGDPDGLFQLVHHLLSPSVDIRGVIGSHLRPGDPFDPSDITAENAVREIENTLALLRMAGTVPIYQGSNTAMPDRKRPVRSAGAMAIVAEAMRDDTDLPLFLCCGASLTELASAWLIEPRIAERLTVIWIGGNEDPALALTPPNADPVEYNLNIDIVAGQVVFNDSDLALWQVPRNVYRQTLMAHSELRARVRPCGELGHLLVERIEGVMQLAGDHGLPLGETYIMGDSPLVLLTALQSAFQADASSSSYLLRPAPSIDEAGASTFSADGRPIRVYTQLDLRLMFEDFFTKLANATA